MTQKTIKALYKQPVDYKLIRDGYKTINGVINAQDGMPKVLDLPVPSELYTTDLEYNVDIDVNGAPVITTSEFTLPDDQVCEAKEYCYAPKGTNYNYRKMYSGKIYDNFTKIGNPTISQDGLVTDFSSTNYLQIPSTFPSFTNCEVIFKALRSSDSQFGSLIAKDDNSVGAAGVDSSNGAFGKNNGNGWTSGQTNIELNKWYWYKIIGSGSNFTGYLIEDNNYTTNTLPNLSNWSQEWSNSGDTFTGEKCIIGNSLVNDHEFWVGSIDLSGCSIKIDNEIWWLPYRDVNEIITFQIPGILDSSVTTDDWQHSQEYKLYQLKNQNNTDTLQLTENSITDTTQKYKQYINQLTIPARNYKWYYNGIPQSKYANFWSRGAIIENEIGIDFTGGPIEVYPLNYMGYDSNIVTAIFNIETGDITTDCVFFDMYSDYEEEASVLFAIRNSKFSYNTYADPTQIIYGDTILSSNTKYWVALSLDKTQMKLELYLIQDNNYSKEQLPDISLWLKQFEYNITNPETMYVYSYIGASISSSVLISSFNGKVYLNNMFATRDLTTSYEYLCWESYSYSNFIYRWYANKSLYDYTENESYADILNFSNSWVNVTNNWKTQKNYVNPEVFLMPTNGGETVTEYSPNGILVGNISFDRYEGILSDASPSDYLTLPEPFMPEDKTWEVNIKVKTPSTTDEMHYIMGSLTEYYWTIGGELSANNSFGFGITSNGEAWDIAWLAGTTIITPDTWYWIRLTFTGTEYKFELSTDGEVYNLEASVENSTPIYQDSTNSYIHLGTQATGFSYWTGEIDLTQCKIKINDELWWNGTSITSIQNNVYKIKERVVVNYDNLLNLPSTLIDGTNFELSGNTFRNGSASYQVASYGYSYGYFTYTPSRTQTITIKASVSSESGCDYGACYIGTKQYKASFDNIRAGNTDGYGSWLFSISGEVSTTTYTYTLQKGITYYIEFYYAKDQSVNTGNDRFIVSGLSGFVSETEKVTFLSGCLYNYNDEGEEHNFDVYYDSNYTQPVLVSSGESYIDGTKVDTITIPAHRTWGYTTGGNWGKITYVDTSYSNYTYDAGNLVLTKYTGSDTDVIVPNAVI